MPFPLSEGWYYSYRSPEALHRLGLTPVAPEDVPVWVQIRSDAVRKATTKQLNCRKGVTVPCGNVCRRPENCSRPGPQSAPSALDLVQKKLAEKRGEEGIGAAISPGKRQKRRSRGRVKDEPAPPPERQREAPPPAPTPQRNLGKGKVRSAQDAISSGQSIAADFLKTVTRPNPQLETAQNLRVALTNATPSGIKFLDSQTPTIPKLMALKAKAESPEDKAKINKAIREHRLKSRQALLKKVEEKEAQLGKADIESARKLLDDLVESSTVSQEDAEAMVDSLKLTNIPKEHRAEMVRFMRLTNGQAMDSLQSVTLTPGRGAAKPWEGTVTYDGDISTLYHEMAHHVEFSAANEEGRFAREWVKGRASGKPQKLSTLTGVKYKDDEIAYPDKFINPYVGKTYKHKGMPATEVYSMGIEHFHSPEALARFARQDPEHFALVLGAMRQRPQVRSVRGPESRANPINLDDLAKEFKKRGMNIAGYRDMERKYISKLPQKRREELGKMSPKMRAKAIGRDVLMMSDNFNTDSRRSVCS